MKVTAEFACGNGKNIVELSPGEFRIEEVGEKAPYCKYFCVRVDGGEGGGLAKLNIYPDPLLSEPGRIGFIGHYPSQLWMSTQEMTFWQPVNNRLQGADVFREDHIETTVPVGAGESVFVASNPVWPYGQAIAWAEALRARGASVDALGKSFEGRVIPRLHLPATGGRKLKVAVLSGQHPSEHCATMCAAGVMEFLLSAHPEAAAVRQACEVMAVPMVNVDGNVHGRNGWTMQDVNPHPDFLGAADGQAPAALEDQLTWRWLAEEFQPDLLFHFHGYMGVRACADPPSDGMYVFNDPAAVYADAARQAMYRRILDTLVWDTPAASAFIPFPEHDETTLDWQLARACGTLSVFYEINHGYAGVMASRRRGADVFRAVMRTVLA